MTAYTFVPKSSSTTVDWDDPTIWSGGTVPNAADADVGFPIVTYAGTNTHYLSIITIKSGQTFAVRSIDLHDTLNLTGTLNVSGTLDAGEDSYLNLSGGTLTAGTLIGHGSGIGGSGTVTVSTFSNMAGLGVSGDTLTINATSFSNSGTILASNGTLNINVASGGLSGLNNGIWSGPLLEADNSGNIAVRAGSVISVDNGRISLGGATITSNDPVTHQDIPLTSSLRTIGSTGTLAVNGDYTFADLRVAGRLSVSGTYNGSGLTVDAGGIIDGFGIITANIINSGKILADVYSATDRQHFLHLTGDISGGGVMEIAAPVLNVLNRGQTSFFIAGIELTGSSDQNVIFDGHDGVLQLDSPSTFTGSITPNGSGDRIYLPGVELGTITGKAYVGDHNGGTLTLQEASGSIALKFVGDFSAIDFVLSKGPQILSSDPTGTYITIEHAPNAGSLLWYLGGQYTFWSAGADNVIHPSNQSSNLPENTAPIAQADFNGDGATDILLQNIATHDLAVLQYEQGRYNLAPNFASSGGGGWSIVGVADYNGDGKADLLWRNDHYTAVWTSKGTSFDTGAYFNSIVGPGWHVVGSGDVDGDGKVDIVWRETGGALSVWTSTGTDFNTNFYGITISRDWHVEGVGDFNGDGKADLVWRNDNGAMNLWASNGHGFDTQFYGVDGVGNDWQIAKTSDINGDGKADLLWRHTSGELSQWLWNGHGFDTSFVPLGAAAAAWHLVTPPADFV